MNRHNNKRHTAPTAALLASLILALPLGATPVMDDEGSRPARDADTIGRTTDLGISTTALPLRRNSDAMWSGTSSDADARQSFVIEPGTLGLVGLGLLGFVVSRRLTSGRRRG